MDVGSVKEEGWKCGQLKIANILVCSSSLYKQLLHDLTSFGIAWKTEIVNEIMHVNSRHLSTFDDVCRFTEVGLHSYSLQSI